MAGSGPVRTAPLTPGMSCFGIGRRSGGGKILLADGKTHFDGDFLIPGRVIKDIINDICQLMSPPIVPVVRPFFALCEPGTGYALCQSMKLTAPQSRKTYQLRIFINAGQNSVCLKKYSGAARNYYFTQLKTDFITGRLQHRMASSGNIALQMAAIDMVLEAVSHKPKPLTSYEDVLDHFKVSKFLPSYVKSQQAWKKTLSHLFEEYYQALSTREPDVIKVQYIYAYEKDIGCGQHLFQAKVYLFPDRPLYEGRIQASWKNGIVMMAATRKEVILMQDIEQIDVSLERLSLSIQLKETAASLNSTSSNSSTGGATDTDSKSQNPITKTLQFKSVEEMISFCSIIDGYYRLKVDINTSILSGDASPADNEHTKETLGKDIAARDLCHGPISKESANEVFAKQHNEEGLYLVRESRTKDCTFILSLCQKEGVFNYRISKDYDHRFALVDTTGISPVPRSVNSCHTLNDLILHHHHFADGLPILLKQNCPPSKTGPMPLFPETPNTPTAVTVMPPPEEELDSPIIQELVQAGVRRIHYRRELTVLKELGSGHFSSVHLAEWTEPGKEVRKVAIKIPTFPQQTSKAQVVLDEMKREILTMYQLDHQYITTLLGVADERHILDTIGRFPMIVMEFIDGGSLRGILNDFRPSRLQPRPIKPPPSDWEVRYLRYSQQIAEGMDYLGSRNVVHRDLATRNVLVVSDQHVKIADFGLARQFMENRDYYRSTKRTDLPVYWYAPECLIELNFKPASDVWSFGVTLWEIFTLGRRPQEFLEHVVMQAQADPRHGHPLQALAKYFKSNNRLPNIGIPDQIYRMLKETWHIDPSRRPTFSHLSDKLSRQLLLFQATSATS
ncbi:PREDICTED: tyrosine-protein kinase JAK2-like [Amphimedon queenslandica]|uniref:Tyrosine-protein kinase n=1 Tax=Amphimedon queenslandica TaxID=400682 RepID=A0A1X7VFN0_AMPQE|nr:PREDICTED: tyrosine-protein kinase JAK2-like [Amphimedon queenslandica]|eukprot:XP_019849121.1 PREDICTED: tyrosine-protein kinase JAK2-like [Amphimedon queenslandica]